MIRIEDCVADDVQTVERKPLNSDAISVTGKSNFARKTFASRTRAPTQYNSLFKASPVALSRTGHVTPSMNGEKNKKLDISIFQSFTQPYVKVPMNAQKFHEFSK
jgi:hypothetical protein